MKLLHNIFILINCMNVILVIYTSYKIRTEYKKIDNELRNHTEELRKMTPEKISKDKNNEEGE